jgi:hypothetical protein
VVLADAYLVARMMRYLLVASFGPRATPVCVEMSAFGLDVDTVFCISPPLEPGTSYM